MTLLIVEASPVALAINNTRADIPNIIVIDSGGLRYDVFEGPFTKNDQLTAVPFADVFYYIPNVMASVANQVLPALNGGSSSKRSEVEKELWGRGHVESRYRAWLQDMEKRQGARATNTTNLTLGYVTTDVRRLLSSLRSCSLTCPSFFFFGKGLSWRWRRHAPHPAALLLGSRLRQLQLAQRDG